MNDAKKKGILTALALALVGGVGYLASVITKDDDGYIEETAEDIIENQLEESLKLPRGSRKGTIDLTPKSKERLATA